MSSLFKPAENPSYHVLKPLIDKIIIENAFQVIDTLPDDSIDLIVADGPYAVTRHEWDKVENIQQFNLELIKRFSRVLKPGGSAYLFGKHDMIDFIDYRPYLNLKSKIVWYQPSRLSQGRISYTNNYDVISFFTKGRPGAFNLDDIRVPQLVELEHRLRVEKVPSVKKGRFGKTKFHNKGKNPGDVWGDIKQLTYRSKELVSREMLNTIQKPKKLIERLVLASSNHGDIILDPFTGSGTLPLVARENQRRFIAVELNSRYARVSAERLADHGHPVELINEKRFSEIINSHPEVFNGISELPQKKESQQIAAGSR